MDKEKEIKRTILIILTILVAPLFILLLSKLGIFDYVNNSKYEDSNEKTEYLSYLKNEPEFWTVPKKQGSSSRAVRYENNSLSGVLYPRIFLGSALHQSAINIISS